MSKTIGRAPSAPGSLNRADRGEHDELELELITETRGPWPGWKGHLSRKGAPTNELKPSGRVPSALFGHLFVNSAAGTVQSGGLPLKGEQVTTILAGDAYMMRFDMDGAANKVTVKTRLLRTPCFYLDEETSKREDLRLYRFANHGILRFNWLLGARNMNNTAFYSLPSKDQKVDDPCRLLVTWDAGRPWEIDPISMEPKTPVGWRHEWVAEAFGTHPFPVTFGTAHPQWDARTQELFTVNYGKGMDALMKTVPIMNYVSRAQAFLYQRSLELLIGTGAGRLASAGVAIKLSLDRERTEVQDSTPSGYLPQRFTYVMRWDGKGAMQRFQLVTEGEMDPDLEKQSIIARFLGRKQRKEASKGILGASIAIDETVHQMCITRNFIILLDTGFKVGLDALYGDPFPFLPKSVRGFFKTVTTRAVTPYSTFHIVSRADLDTAFIRWDTKSDAEKRKDRTPDVKAVTVRVPSAACHFVADYEDDGNQVVLHVAHSDATDVGEWVREGAVNPYTGEAVPDALLGLPGISAIDTNRLARYVIDVENHRVVDSAAMSKNPFTWTVALYAERTAGIPTNFSDRVESIYWNSMGFFPELATAELRELYADYIHRSTPLAEIDRMPNTGGRPSTLMRLNVDRHSIDDHFILPPGFVCSSPQFIPRKKPRTSVPPDEDGFLTAMVFPPDLDGAKAVPELWVFDAADLGKGPLCMLRSDKLSVGFTIHSAWLGALQPYDPDVYKVDLREDFGATLDNRRRAKLKPVFEKLIYPKFD